MNLSIHSHTIKSLFKGLSKAWWVFVTTFVALVFILGGLTYLHNQKKVGMSTFDVTSKVIIMPDSNGDSVDGPALQVYVNTEKEILGSEKFNKYISKNMKQDIHINSDQFLNYSINNPNGTAVIEITATSTTEKNASKISKYIAELVANDSLDVLQGGEAKIIDYGSKVVENTVQSNKMLYVFAIFIAFILSIISAFIKAYYDPRIYDHKLIVNTFSDSNVYLVRDKNQLKNSFMKILRSSIVMENIENLDVAISYFEKEPDYIPEVLEVINKMNISVDVNKFSDAETSLDEEKIKNYSLDELYTFGKDKISGISFVDNSIEINIKNGIIHVLNVHEGQTTKKQIAEIYDEIKQIKNANLFVVYFK
ncbi:hypothetical protein RD055328_10830 [Companilactobacillus sp. RD055328]|uniref:hypothetical protein n=1 Tax=Companilactobacillus sp. RD055328 TaxID=2916634 RepID=UPI001FC8C690|nr:hypothetical protein [Companilactobacillus sp. RD055328]GKQ43160.1 hypothetical protein RD055328_10830 [Companilactobacillus sp. RD055328]